jgi:predicted CXXCH cytochrome family protein
MDAALRRKHGGRPVERAACHQCHEPHASARAGLFRESVHAPFEAGDCGTCHAAPGASDADPFAILKPVGALCGECHSDAVEASRHAPFPHVSAGGGRCVECHNPHTGDGSGLLRKETQALCLGCHDPGGSSSGVEGRHRSHAGFECTTCHAPHGGERPLLFVEDSVEVCGTCHTHEHGVRHPLGEETRDPRTGNPMSCLSCHGIHRAEGEWYLFEADQRMLCIGCHKDLQGR